MTDKKQPMIIDKVMASAPISGAHLGADLGLSILLDGEGLKLYLTPNSARALAAGLMKLADRAATPSVAPAHGIGAIAEAGHA